MNVAAQRRIPEKKHQELIGKLLGDVCGAMSGALVLVGDKLGFYRTLAEAVPLAPTSLAARAGAALRYVREWSAAQAAGSAPRATSPVILYTNHKNVHPIPQLIALAFAPAILNPCS